MVSKASALQQRIVHGMKTPVIAPAVAPVVDTQSNRRRSNQTRRGTQ
jgi:hypothetical protein